MSLDSELIIETVTNQVRALMREHWVEWLGYRDGVKPIKGSVSFSVDARQDDYLIESALSYGIRVKRHISDRVDYPSQIQLNLDGARNSAKPQETEKAALRQ